ncbi:hypothetical protein [Streptomyces collinus]|uniref:hypothetical protein n=1 Tax=Streptomyces collinus TaxID=42684 RepID=UPI00362760BB
MTFCAMPAGHYDESRWPDRMKKHEPGGWHMSGPVYPHGDRLIWNDKADAAVPHGSARLTCPTCGPTALEQHPHQPDILRCRNCKEHMARGRLEGASP